MKQRVICLVVGCVGILLIMVLWLWGVAPPTALSCEGLGCTDAFPELLQSTSKPCLQLACDKSDNDKKDCGDDEVKWEYWENEGQVIRVTLKVNPEIVTDREFEAEWIVSSGEDSAPKSAEVLNDSILYLPPLEVRFLFDLDSAALTPLDRQQAEDEADFWLNLLWEQVIPVFNFDGTPESERGFIYAPDGDGTSELIGDGRKADLIYKYMKDALQRSQAITTTRQSVGGFLDKETEENKEAPPVWVVFRWHSTEDIFAIKDDYGLDELRKKGSRVLVLVLGRSGSPPIHQAWWQYYKKEWADRYKAVLVYVFISSVPSDIGGQLEEFKRQAELTHEKLQIPIRAPRLLSASQRRTTDLVIRYKDKCEVKVNEENLAPSGDGLDISWVWPLFFTILPAVSVLIFVLPVVFFLGVIVIKHDLLGLEDEIEWVLVSPPVEKEE